MDEWEMMTKYPNNNQCDRLKFLNIAMGTSFQADGTAIIRLGREMNRSHNREDRNINTLGRKRWMPNQERSEKKEKREGKGRR
jgi:hypothetical protein